MKEWIEEWLKTTREITSTNRAFINEIKSLGITNQQMKEYQRRYFGQHKHIQELKAQNQKQQEKIEELEKDRDYYKQNLIREQQDRRKQCEKFGERIKQLQAVREAAKEVADYLTNYPRKDMLDYQLEEFKVVFNLLEALKKLDKLKQVLGKGE